MFHGSRWHKSISTDALPYFFFPLAITQSRFEPSRCDCWRPALTNAASDNTPECRLDVSSSGRRFELRVAALGCIASHAAHRLSSSKMELRSYQWKNPQTQLLIEAPPFLCTGRFCGE